jgi:hypothetical protein
VKTSLWAVEFKYVDVFIYMEGLVFEFSIMRGDKPLFKGSGMLGDVTIIMGRYWKSTFLRYLFALLAMDYDLAVHTSEEVLSPGGTARLRVGDAFLECGKAEEDGDVGCSITYRLKKEVYLLYEGFPLTLRYGLTPPLSPGVADAAARLLQLVGDERQGYSSSALLAKALEKAMRQDAWLLIDGLLDGMHPDDVFRLAGLASSAKAWLVVATHSPWVRRAFRCHRRAAETQGMPAADKPATAYEFVDGTVKNVDLVSETYGKAFGKLYEVCG